MFSCVWCRTDLLPARPGFMAMALLLLCCTPLCAQTPVSLQLKWRHGFQFAGYYAAQEKGYYRDAGLDVTLLEAHPGVDVVADVTSGRADFGVGTSGLLVARQAGAPVVVLAAIFQHSPLVLVARKDASVQSVHDLSGRTLMVEPGSEELLAYLRSEHISTDKLKYVEHSFDPQDLIEGRVDAISGYSSNEPFFLDKAGFEYFVFTPRSAGIDFYGDNLFTSEARLRFTPDLVRAFREASLRGWRYAMEHPEEIAELIHSRYSAAQSLDFYLFEARQMVPLMRPDLVEIGYMNPGRWEHIVETYREMGMLRRDFDLRGFLYAENDDGDRAGLRLYLAAALAGLALVLTVAAYIFRINRKLHRSVAETRRAVEELQASQARIVHMAEHDSLTDLPNRALLGDRLGQALSLARRAHHRVALLYIDLDHFKPINDTHGHAVGDLLLQDVALRMRASVRASDTVSRFGGDEFVVLLPQVDSREDALRVAEKIRAALREPFLLADLLLDVSASIGVGVFPDDGGDEEALLQSADRFMYLAKRDGRDRVSAADPR